MDFDPSDSQSIIGLEAHAVLLSSLNVSTDSTGFPATELDEAVSKMIGIIAV